MRGWVHSSAPFRDRGSSSVRSGGSSEPAALFSTHYKGEGVEFRVVCVSSPTGPGTPVSTQNPYRKLGLSLEVLLTGSKSPVDTFS